MSDSPRALAEASRRDMVVGLVRVAVSAAVFLAAYSLLPLDTIARMPSALALVLLLSAFLGVGFLEVRRITTARFPGIRALEALGVLVPLFLLGFSAIYYVLAENDPQAFTEPVDRLDAVYYTVTVFATVGFGDIAAVSRPARITVTIQMLCDLVVVGLGIRVVLGAVRRGRERDHLPADVAP